MDSALDLTLGSALDFRDSLDVALGSAAGTASGRPVKLEDLDTDSDSSVYVPPADAHSISDSAVDHGPMIFWIPSLSILLLQFPPPDILLLVDSETHDWMFSFPGDDRGPPTPVYEHVSDSLSESEDEHLPLIDLATDATDRVSFPAAPLSPGESAPFIPDRSRIADN